VWDDSRRDAVLQLLRERRDQDLTVQKLDKVLAA